MTVWQLPSHIHDHLAPETHWLEAKRRAIVDLYFAQGYRLIMPPVAEYQEALAKGGHDLDRRMLKVVDQISGRMLGLRPDITPQAARIDAHVLAEAGVTRLCYSDRVLHAIPATPFGQREPLQIGAEIYGEAHWHADVEAMVLLHRSLVTCGLSDHHLEMQHMGLLRDLADESGLAAHPQWADLEDPFYQALQIKDQSALRDMFRDCQLSENWAQVCQSLIDCFGDHQSLAKAAQCLAQSPRLLAHVQTLQAIASALMQSVPELRLTFDLSDGRGYHYHSGLMFSAYISGWSQALAHGGRYDGFGERYGRWRPATGFTLDLFEAYRCWHQQQGEAAEAALMQLPYQQRVWADSAQASDADGLAQIERLRHEGIAVIVAPGDAANPASAAKHQGCSAYLQRQSNGSWQLVQVSGSHQSAKT